MNKQKNQFSFQLDQLLGIHPGKTDLTFNGSDESQLLQTGSILNRMEFDSELAPRADIRTRWLAQTRPGYPEQKTRRFFTTRTAWFAALILALVLLIAYGQPVMAAVSRLFGYVYVQDVGFLPADSTLVLQQPVRQEHAGQSLAVTRGIATPNETTLWLEFSDIARSVDGAALQFIPAGQIGEAELKLGVSSWQFSPNTPETHAVVLHFPALPAGTTQTTLSLPEGWRLPLTWISATQSYLPDVRAVPYPITALPHITSLQAVTPENELCKTIYDMQLCVLAAATSSTNTSILMELQSHNPALTPGSWFGEIWRQDVTLKDGQGKVYSLETDPVDGALVFPPVTPNQKGYLTIPSVVASLDISGQSIKLDMGANPQPDTVIPLDITIPVLGTSVHFSKATFVGDGVSSLRLTLDADPVKTVDGITPVSIEIGKPDLVDDLYGGGMLAGSKDIFIELVRPTGKVTGVINIPLLNAILAVQGPFEFTFNLADIASITPVPDLADPGTFSPASTATPISLDAYAYSEQALQSGDLLYTVIDGENTNVYAFTPGAKQSHLLATLPGAVSQIYVHPDKQGLDYLAGVQMSRDGITYIDHICLYTLRFVEPSPRLLYSFASNPTNTIGTTVSADWSFDGKYMAFSFAGSPQPGFASRYGWLDLSCRKDGNCVPQEIPVKKDWELSTPIFAPNDYRMLFRGADYSDTGSPALFLLNFDPHRSNDSIETITPNYLLSDTNFSSGWTPDSKIISVCRDSVSTDANTFCAVDLQTKDVTRYELIEPHINGYRLYNFWWLAPSGNQIVASLFPENATRESLTELRMLDLNGHMGRKLASAQSFFHVSFSPSGQWLTYVTDDEARLNIADMNSGNTIPIQDSQPWSISWVGWAR